MVAVEGVRAQLKAVEALPAPGLQAELLAVSDATPAAAALGQGPGYALLSRDRRLLNY